MAAALVSFAAIIFAVATDSILGRWSDGTNYLTFRRDGTVIARSIGTPGHPGPPVTLKFSTEGNRVVVTNEDGQQLVHQLRGGILVGPDGEHFKRWDITTVIFGFTLAPDGSRHDINVVRCEDSMDRRELKRALTEKEKQIGIQLIAERRAPTPKKDIGTTKYDFILFDNHTRSYIP